MQGSSRDIPSGKHSTYSSMMRSPRIQTLLFVKSSSILSSRSVFIPCLVMKLEIAIFALANLLSPILKAASPVEPISPELNISWPPNSLSASNSGFCSLSYSLPLTTIIGLCRLMNW